MAINFLYLFVVDYHMFRYGLSLPLSGFGQAAAVIAVSLAAGSQVLCTCLDFVKAPFCVGVWVPRWGSWGRGVWCDRKWVYVIDCHWCCPTCVQLLLLFFFFRLSSCSYFFSFAPGVPLLQLLVTVGFTCCKPYRELQMQLGTPGPRHMPGRMPDRMPNRMSEYMPDRMPFRMSE